MPYGSQVNTAAAEKDVCAQRRRGAEAVRALRDRTHLAVHAFAPPVRKARAYVLYDAVHVFLDRTTEPSEGLETTALRPSDPFVQPASRNVVLLTVQDAAQG